MTQSWQRHPKPFVIGVTIFGVNVLLGLLVAGLEVVLGFGLSVFATIAVVISAALVGYGSTHKVKRALARSDRWQAACWSTGIAVLATVVVRTLGSNDLGLSEGIGGLGMTASLILLLIAVALGVAVTYAGLWCGEKLVLVRLDQGTEEGPAVEHTDSNNGGVLGGVLALIGIAPFVVLWLFHLAFSNFRGGSQLEAMGMTLADAVDPTTSGSAFFGLALASIVIGCATAVVFFKGKPRAGLAVTGCHTGVALGVYQSIGWVVPTALPLVLAPKILQSDEPSEGAARD